MVLPSLGVFWGLYLVSFLFVLCAEDWFGVWVGLEINMLSFIVMVYSGKGMMNVESCMKYFFIQSLGSAVFMSLFYFGNGILEEGLVMVMSMKIGAGPMYFWFPSVCEGLGWGGCLLLMVFQKVLPMMIIMMFLGWMVWVIVWMSLLVGMMGSFNQVKVKLLLAYSSIHHIGWMMLCGNSEDYMWLFYIMVYGVVLLSVVGVLSEVEIDNVFSVVKQKGKWWFLFGVMSMGGVPPMLGFFLSWFAFYWILKMSVIVVGLMMIISVVMLYVYMRMLYVVLMGNSSEFSWGFCNVNGGEKKLVDFLGLIGFLIGFAMMVLIFW